MKDNKVKPMTLTIFTILMFLMTIGSNISMREGWRESPEYIIYNDVEDNIEMSKKASAPATIIHNLNLALEGTGDFKKMEIVGIISIVEHISIEDDAFDESMIIIKNAIEDIPLYELRRNMILNLYPNLHTVAYLSCIFFVLGLTFIVNLYSLYKDLDKEDRVIGSLLVFCFSMILSMAIYEILIFF